MDLNRLQGALHRWRKRNFPEAEAAQQLLGMVEEIGELSHAHLKRVQGIRGTVEEHEIAEQDAIADLTIFMMGYCSYRGWNFFNLVHDVATGVMKRNWKKYPVNGYSE